MYATFQSKDFVILGVSLDNISPSMMQQFVKEHDLRFPILLDSRHEVAQLYSVRGTPTTYLINRTGMVIGGTVGPKDWNSDAAKKIIEQFLQKT